VQVTGGEKRSTPIKSRQQSSMPVGATTLVFETLVGTGDKPFPRHRRALGWPEVGASAEVEFMFRVGSLERVRTED
jgi:hypothetical protein